MLFTFLSCFFFLPMILLDVFIFKKPTGSILPNMFLSLCICDSVPFLIKLDCKTFPSGCISPGFLLSHPLSFLLSFLLSSLWLPASPSPPVLQLSSPFDPFCFPSFCLPHNPFVFIFLLEELLTINWGRYFSFSGLNNLINF